MPRLLPPALLLLACGASGCVLDRRGQSSSHKYQEALREHGEKIALLQAGFDDAETRLTRLEDQSRARSQEEIMKMDTLEQVRSEVSRLRGDLEVLRHDFDTTRTDSGARIEDAAFRLDWLESRAALLEKSLGVPTPPPPARPEPAPPSAGGGEPAEGPAPAPAPAPAPSGDEGITDPAALLAKAEEHLAAGRPKAAEAVLDRFLKLHPKDERVPEAMYRRAEAAFNMKDWAAAVLRFQEVIDKHKKSVWAAYAMYRQGECFEAQGQLDNARLFWEDVIRLWPDTKAAKMAKKKLGR